VLAHAELNQKFLRQAASVQAILPGAAGEKPLVAFTLTGEPVSADGRSAFRVSIVAANVPATVGQDDQCQLVNVSATGFGVYSKSAFAVGGIVEVELTYNNLTCAGKARVQSASETRWGTMRYGLHAVEAPRGHGKNGLQTGLGQIAAAIQRDQLRRMARA
jgi:hypothetical protein